jgi:HAMP domain-containing protein
MSVLWQHTAVLLGSVVSAGLGWWLNGLRTRRVEVLLNGRMDALLGRLDELTEALQQIEAGRRPPPPVS